LQSRLKHEKGSKLGECLGFKHTPVTPTGLCKEMISTFPSGVPNLGIGIPLGF